LNRHNIQIQRGKGFKRKAGEKFLLSPAFFPLSRPRSRVSRSERTDERTR